MMASLDALSVFSSRTYASRTRSSVSVTVGGAMPYFLHVDAANRRLHQTHRVKDAQVSARSPAPLRLTDVTSILVIGASDEVVGSRSETIFFINKIYIRSIVTEYLQLV